MDKRSEIREGIALRLHTQARSLLRVVYERSSLNCMWEELPEYWKDKYCEEADIVMRWLASQGVVLKIDRELPRNPYLAKTDWPKSGDTPEARAYRDAQLDMAGYTAWKSLIEVEK